MFELGEESLAEHKSLVDLVVKNNSGFTYFIGKDFYSNKIQNEKCRFFITFEEFSEHLVSINIENSLLLIKGSRGMALERTLQILP
jgi:UDP-N-acetylmuramoyl-tripeptide--D-alanyl-D-alanine ligase